MTQIGQEVPTTASPHFATLLVMALAPEQVGKRIAQARKARGWTHQQFLEQVQEHINPKTNLRTVQRWQTGKNPSTGKSWLPRLGTLMELADVLGVPRSWFVEDEAPLPADEAASLRNELAALQAKVDELLRRSEPPQSRAEEG